MASGAADAARERHARYFAAFVRDAGPRSVVERRGRVGPARRGRPRQHPRRASLGRRRRRDRPRDAHRRRVRCAGRRTADLGDRVDRRRCPPHTRRRRASVASDRDGRGLLGGRPARRQRRGPRARRRGDRRPTSRRALHRGGVVVRHAPPNGPRAIRRGAVWRWHPKRSTEPKPPATSPEPSRSGPRTQASCSWTTAAPTLDRRPNERSPTHERWHSRRSSRWVSSTSGRRSPSAANPNAVWPWSANPRSSRTRSTRTGNR